MGFQLDRQGIATDQGPAEIGAAVDDRQGDGRRFAGGGKQFISGDAEAFQALLIGLVAPAQQLVEVHHAGGVRVAEAHLAAELQPAVGVHAGHVATHRQGPVLAPGPLRNYIPADLQLCLGLSRRLRKAQPQPGLGGISPPLISDPADLGGHRGDQWGWFSDLLANHPCWFRLDQWQQ